MVLENITVSNVKVFFYIRHPDILEEVNQGWNYNKTHFLIGRELKTNN